MSKLFFEDFQPGRTFDFGDYLLEADAVTWFHQRFDPLSDADGPETASPFHITAALSRMACDGVLLNAHSQGGPGVPDLRWSATARAGDILFGGAKVREARASRTKPHLGFVQFTFDILKQPATPVATLDGGVIFTVRNPLPAQLPDQRKSVAAPDGRLKRQPGAAGGLSGARSGIRPGDTFDLGTFIFERDEIVAFASRFDPQTFHLNEEAASATHFGSLAASGWHTTAALSRLLAERRQSDGLTARRRLTGFHDLRWLQPVRAGDTLRYEATVAEIEPASRPHVVTLACRAVNQDGKVPFEVTLEELWPDA